jgi:hypothetical protein
MQAYPKFILPDRLRTTNKPKLKKRPFLPLFHLKQTLAFCSARHSISFYNSPIFLGIFFVKHIHMKKFVVYAAFICSLFVSCNAQEGSNGESEKKEEKKISKRDISINKSNSYSDLFLDSLTVEKFITTKKIPDSLSRRIRSFYNTRNYQFAWFTSKGLTEQARGFWNLHDYHTTYNHDTLLHSKTLQKTMDNLIAEEDLSVSATNKNFINTELTLTNHFIQVCNEPI